MAVIQEVFADAEPIPKQWEVSSSGPQQRSPIPRGLITFVGTDAIAAKIATNEIDYRIVMTMPPGFVYLPRNLLVRAQSDDLVNNWEPQGLGMLNRPSVGASAVGSIGLTSFTMSSPGVISVDALVAARIFTPDIGSPKLLLAGGDVLQVRLADMDAGASAAGDVSYFAELYVFDPDQVDKWQVNTPIPIINHASF